MLTNKQNWKIYKTKAIQAPLVIVNRRYLLRCLADKMFHANPSSQRAELFLLNWQIINTHKQQSRQDILLYKTGITSSFFLQVNLTPCWRGWCTESIRWSLGRIQCYISSFIFIVYTTDAIFMLILLILLKHSPHLNHAIYKFILSKFTLCCCLKSPGQDQHCQRFWVELKVI